MNSLVFLYSGVLRSANSEQYLEHILCQLNPFYILTHFFFSFLFNKIMLQCLSEGLRQLSRYSNSLRAGRSGDRILVRVIFPHPSRPEPEPTQPPVQWVPSFFPGVKRPGRCFDHPLPSSTQVKERVEL
jgi:hypothetical protein